MSSNGLPLPNSAPCSRFSNAVSSKPLTCTTFVARPPPIDVSTTVPRLRIAANASEATRADAPGQLLRQLVRLLGGRHGVRRAQRHRRLALELHRVDRDDVPRPGVRGALHGVDADAADAVDDR